MIPKLRLHLRGARGLTVERAKLKWLEGNLSAGVGWGARAENLLETARGQLVELGLKHDIAAITADLARVRWPERRGIRAVCRAVLDLVLPEHAEILHRIIAEEGDPLPLIEDLRRAAT
ncbi:MAG: hypothetical protein GY835_04650 [bacterium]|nr:hypothetical protein [bacterium]